jgi:outer membrane protein assembly factor BamB
MNPPIHFARPLLAGCLLLANAVFAQDWTHWRGPDFNGSSSAKGLPETFSKTEHVKWASAMPGPSAATPIILGDRVFVSSTDKESQSLLALCLDRKTGKELWRKTAAPGFRRDDKSNYASPSPTTDGMRVYFFYGTSDLIAFDFDGTKVWSRNIEKDYGQFAFQWTFASSPLVHGGVLYLQVLQRDVPAQGRGVKDGLSDSYLLGLDPRTGKQIFKVVRPTEARQESREAFSSPIPHTSNGRTEILVSGGDMLSGHDPKTGDEYWRWGTWNPNRITHWRLVPSPVAAEGVVLGCGPKNAPVFAIKLGLHGTLNDEAIAWSSSEDRDLTSDVPTPLFYDGLFYVLNGNKKLLLAVEPKTGKTLWTGRFDSRSQFESSPTAADGKIYSMNMQGEVFVAKAGKAGFELLHKADFGDDTDRALRSSIVLSEGQLFIRAGATLYCLGK